MTVHTRSFNSSAILVGEYDDESEQLTLEFANGRSYEYSNVPEDIWNRLCDARSAGSFFHSNIKDRY